MNHEIRYLDINQIDFSKISIKGNNILYQYPDGIIKKLYVKTSYLPIVQSKFNNKIIIEVMNFQYFFEELNKKM